MKSQQIRQQFLDYFAAKQHQVVASSSLIPANDPTLLFVNAGMVQFKDVFLGKEKRPYSRATSSQRCLRAGGKHNDLENVGYTARHHTFFEMLGNFSFGDYFKREAIQFAWEFLTKELKLSEDKLWVTVYKDDKEAEDIWLNEMGVSAERFSRCGDKDNFWSMGDTGPCGPCTEIFYDHGKNIPGGPPGSPDEDKDRYIEIWNLVFMQYERAADGTLTPLAKQSVDTGMGLERLAAVLQGVHNNYETDLFMPIIEAAAKIAGIKDVKNQSLRVVADHIRSTAFLIIDGVRPSNEGRGYVLRRIMRRAIRHGHKLGVQDLFFHKLINVLVEVMGGACPELVESQAVVEKIILQEEKQFAKTLDQGMQLLNTELANLKGKKLSGEILFKLYDTYGFPLDLTADIIREKGLEFDQAGFDAAMAKQRSQSKAASQFKMDVSELPELKGETKFLGYKDLELSTKLSNIIYDNQLVDKVSEGDQCILILDQTPFYAESGGQVGDAGKIISDSACFVVKDTQKQGDVVLHAGFVEKGVFETKEKVTAKINVENRKATMRNHSATHLLHAALRKILGEHVVQKGSLVGPDYFRFDFAHTQPVTDEEIIAIEQCVNQHVMENDVVETKLMTPAEAKKAGAMALFGEKYGDEVRVLTMGEFSKELCGGTHVARTGDIGLFKITGETGIASGVRRIEALTGFKALEYVEQEEGLIKQLGALFKADKNVLLIKAEQAQQQVKQLEKTLSQLQDKLHGQASAGLLSEVKELAGIKLLVSEQEGVDAKALRPLLDQLKSKLPDRSVIVLASRSEGKANLIAGVSKDLIKSIHAGELIKMLAEQVGGKGGGRPDMAQAGGSQPERLVDALASVEAWVKNKQN